MATRPDLSAAGLEFHTPGLEGGALNLSLCLPLNPGLIQKQLVWGLCAQKVDWQSAKSMYDFHALDIDGHDVSLEIYRQVGSHLGMFALVVLVFGWVLVFFVFQCF
uniref:Uncharacterized protein n=1 Tax=Naja naja TaxID=35670 RepID=A0A8C6V3R8_NAJNA